MDSNYDATIHFNFCINNFFENGVGLTILGLITMVLPCFFFGKNLENHGKKMVVSPKMGEKNGAFYGGKIW